MDNPQGVLRTGDRASVEFEFISHPEYVKEGMKLLFREGKTKVSATFSQLEHINCCLDVGPWCNYKDFMIMRYILLKLIWRL